MFTILNLYNTRSPLWICPSTFTTRSLGVYLYPTPWAISQVSSPSLLQIKYTLATPSCSSPTDTVLYTLATYTPSLTLSTTIHRIALLI